MRLRFIKYVRNFFLFFNKKIASVEQPLKLTQAEWDKMEKEFLAQLHYKFSEITGSIQNLRNNEANPFIKSQLCLAFIGADTFGRFHLIFEGQRKNLDFDNKRRFKKWLNTFVFTSKNNIYQMHKEKIKCDAGRAWQLRNSLLHFYSFPEPEKNGRRVEFLYNIPDSFRQKFENFLKKEGQKIILVDARYLIDAILQGFLIQHQYFKKMIENFPNQYVNAVLFAHEIVMRNGSYTIKFDIKENE